MLGLCVLGLIGCKNESKIDLNFADKYEGKTVELISFADSTVLGSAVIENGKASFINQESDSLHFPLLTQLVIDGRVKAYYVMEAGEAVLADSLSVVSGTPLNEQFGVLLSQLDSVENLDDMGKYIAFAEGQYNAHRDTPFGTYFGVEWLKYADPLKVDSFMNKAPKELRESKRAKYYENFARHRAQTSPGMPYIDFAGEDAKGRKVMLSQLAPKGKYVLVDFWASWCPYCIKELPELTELYSTYKDKGLEIVGVAVRDKTSDTEAMVEKKNIPWKILYNTQKVPYDIYGFSGIPHHMLIGPDGKIISRGESASELGARLSGLLK